MNGQVFRFDCNFGVGRGEKEADWKLKTWNFPRESHTQKLLSVVAEVFQNDEQVFYVVWRYLMISKEEDAKVWREINNNSNRAEIKVEDLIARLSLLLGKLSLNTFGAMIGVNSNENSWILTKLSHKFNHYIMKVCFMRINETLVNSLN